METTNPNELMRISVYDYVASEPEVDALLEQIEAELAGKE